MALPPSMNENKNSFHANIKQSIEVATMPDFKSGSTTCKRTSILE
jgi:hypothetical protein